MLLTICVAMHLTFDVNTWFCVELQQWDHRDRGRDGALCVSSFGLGRGPGSFHAGCSRQCFLRSLPGVQGRDCAPLRLQKLFSSSSTKGCRSRSPGWYLEGRSGWRSRSAEGGIGIGPGLGLGQALLSIQNLDEDKEGEVRLGFERTAFTEKGIADDRRRCSTREKVGP